MDSAEIRLESEKSEVAWTWYYTTGNTKKAQKMYLMRVKVQGKNHKWLDRDREFNTGQSPILGM